MESKRKNSATHKRFRLTADERTKIAEMNWRDNPWFPAILERARLKDQKERPDSYEHVWEGGFATAIDGAYFAAALNQAKHEGRIGRVAADPLMSIKAFWDLGGRGMKSDATAIWITQFIGKEIRVIDYYEAVGQPLAAHVAWLRERKYDKAICILPHDGAPVNPVADASWQTALEDAGFDVEVIRNQGAGAAKLRIEAARRIFPAIWFNADTTEAGREALGWYHEKKSDDDRDVGLGPEHDWSSHGADAFGLMCVAYEAPIIAERRDAYASARRAISAGWQRRNRTWLTITAPKRKRRAGQRHRCAPAQAQGLVQAGCRPCLHMAQGSARGLSLLQQRPVER
jgi:phage terminase large subunit